MAQVTVRQFSGDIRGWGIESNGSQTPVIPESTDVDGNQPIETESLTFTYEPGETSSITSRRRGARFGQTIFSKSQPGQTTMSVTFLEMPIPILARQFYGDAANADIAEGSVTEADFTVEVKNVPIALPHRFVKSSPAPVVEAGGTPLTAGTDYVIDYRRGTLMIKAAGVDVGDVLQLSYSYEQVTGTTILGGALPEKDFFFSGDMQDRNTLEDGLLQIWQARLSVDSDIDWLSTEPVKPTLTGPLITPVGKPSPYRFDLYKQAT
jgi:hypothetical protein